MRDIGYNQLILQNDNLLEELKMAYFDLDSELNAANRMIIEQKIQWCEKKIIEILNQLDKEHQQKTIELLNEIWKTRRNNLRKQIEEVDRDFSQESTRVRQYHLNNQRRSIEEEIKAFDRKIVSYKVQLKTSKKDHNYFAAFVTIVLVLFCLLVIIKTSSSQPSISTQAVGNFNVPDNAQQSNIVSVTTPQKKIGPLEVAEAYYKALDTGVKSGDFSKAYKLLSPTRRGERSLEDNYSDTRAIEIEKITPIARSEEVTKSTVFVSVVLTLSDNQKQRYQGTYSLIFENQQWYMDSHDVRKVVE